MGAAAASAGAAGPSEGLRAGRSSGRTKPEDTAASGRRDHATFGSGPTRQSDDRDSEPDYLLCLTMHRDGPGMIYNSGKGSFYLTTFRGWSLEDSNSLLFFLSNGIFSRLSVADLNCNKRDRGFGRIFRSYPHSNVAYTRALQQSRGIQEGSFRLGRVTATVSYSRIFLRPNTIQCRRS